MAVKLVGSFTMLTHGRAGWFSLLQFVLKLVRGIGAPLSVDVQSMTTVTAMRNRPARSSARRDNHCLQPLKNKNAVFTASRCLRDDGHSY